MRKPLYYIYINRLGIDIQLYCSQMKEDGVIKSAFKIVRAARFCILETRSILVLDVAPNVCYHSLEEVKRKLDKTSFVCLVVKG